MTPLLPGASWPLLPSLCALGRFALLLRVLPMSSPTLPLPQVSSGRCLLVDTFENNSLLPMDPHAQGLRQVALLGPGPARPLAPLAARGRLA